jgi:hypothetical protein
MWSALWRHIGKRNRSNHAGANATRHKAAKRTEVRVSRFENLEERSLLSVAPTTTTPIAISTNSGENQAAAAVAVAPSGDYVVAWSGSVTSVVNNVTVNYSDPFFRRYSAAGIAKDTQQMAVTDSMDTNTNVQVAVDGSGNFVVVWVDQDSAGDENVFFQRYNAAGTALGSATQVNTQPGGVLVDDQPQVGMQSDGDFMVVWDRQLANGNGEVFYRSYTAAGAAKINETPVNADGNNQSEPTVAVNSYGYTLIAWSEVRSGMQNIFFTSILPAGTVSVAPTQADASAGTVDDSPSIAVDARGYGVIAWHQTGTSGTGSIYVQQTNLTGNLLDGAGLLIAGGSVDNNSPSVGYCGSQFVVSYLQNTGSQYEAFFQEYTDSGTANGAATNFNTGSAAASVAVSMDATGDFAVVVEHPTSTQSSIQGLNYLTTVSTVGLYDPSALIFDLRNSNTAGVADIQFRFNAATSALIPLSGDWTGGGSVGVGDYDPTTSTFYLSNTLVSPVATTVVQFGPANGGWVPLVGDWDGNGSYTIGLYNPVTSIFYLRNSNSVGNPDVIFQFGAGNSGWTPIVGDWLGNGITSVGLYDPVNSIFYIKNTATGGYPDKTFNFGPASTGWLPVTGDWTHSGTDGVGLYNQSYAVFYLRNTLTPGAADSTINFGQPFTKWLPLANHWLPGGDTPGLYDPTTGTFYLRDALSNGPANQVFTYGPASSTWVPVTGDWNDDGITTVGLYDPTTETFYLRNTNTPGDADLVVQFSTTIANAVPLVGDWTGDGTYTTALYDPAASVFYFKNTNVSGAADTTAAFGPPGGGWTPLAGDWSNTGVTGIGLYDSTSDATSGLFFLRNQPTTGAVDNYVGYGPPNSGWTPLVGDWVRNGPTTVGLFNSTDSMFYLRNSNTAGLPDSLFNYGPPGAGWIPLCGDWTGVGENQLVTGGPASPANADTSDTLTASVLQGVVSQAIAGWVSAGLPQQLATNLAKVEVVIADLPGSDLGLTVNSTIFIASNAAGYGWYTDTGSPSNPQSTSTQQPLAGTKSGAVNRVDLLTVVTHELGHILGLPDEDPAGQDIMSENLAPGVRRTVTAADVDAVFAEPVS